MDTIKLQKYFTDCGVMSRRAAEKEIADGKVSVNGETAHAGMRINPETDVVEYRGARVEKSKSAGRKVYVLLNKPAGYLTTMSDDRGRKTVAELVADVGTRVYPVGRLDADSEGLLLLTNDGDLTSVLTHPRHGIPKIYHVKVQGEVKREQVWAMGKAMDIDGYMIKPVQTELISVKPDHSVLKLTLFEGRNRQIRKMCDQCGLKILRLCRIAIGDIKLGTLAPGKWRYLTASQVEYLKSAGKKINKTKTEE